MTDYTPHHHPRPGDEPTLTLDPEGVPDNHIWFNAAVYTPKSREYLEAFFRKWLRPERLPIRLAALAAGHYDVVPEALLPPDVFARLPRGGPGGAYRYDLRPDAASGQECWYRTRAEAVAALERALAADAPVIAQEAR